VRDREEHPKDLMCGGNMFACGARLAGYFAIGIVELLFLAPRGADLVML